MSSSTISTNRATVRLIKDVRACELCSEFLPLGPRPVLQVHVDAKILIAGQAPGSKVHKTGVPFDDPSGDRLRDWMGIDKATFYDETRIAILPMGFCYPGTGKSGDLPPRPECAATWRAKLLARMPGIQLTLVIGQYAQAWHLHDTAKATLTDTVEAWQEYWPKLLPLPHPSPRNNIWLKRNAWFEKKVLPLLKGRVENVLR
jgi:uracil-DNA glycosylase